MDAGGVLFFLVDRAVCACIYVMVVLLLLCYTFFFHPYQHTAGSTGQAYENRKSPSCYDPAGTKAQR